MLWGGFQIKHIPVLLDEAVGYLINYPKGTFIDCTFGQGGHSKEILKRIDKSSKLIAFDLDSEARKASRKVSNSNFKFIQDNFKNIGNYFKDNSVDGILIDCGVSSPQLDNLSRGFSFHGNANLDMRFGQSIERSCKEIVNTYSEKDLKRIFKDYGDEKYSSKIAKKIIIERDKREIITTNQLVEIIASVKKIRKKIHPATQVFQALRMEVNDEIRNLQSCIEASKKILKQGGRLVVISFHSLEDKIVKSAFKYLDKAHEKDIPLREDQVDTPEYKMSKIFTPKQEEIHFNPRSRSSKLRVIEKLWNLGIYQ